MTHEVINTRGSAAEKAARIAALAVDRPGLPESEGRIYPLRSTMPSSPFPPRQASSLGPASVPLGRGWEPQDLSSIVDGLVAGTLTVPEPTVGRITGGKALFYRGAINGIHGPSGAGKTLLMQAIASDLLNEGEGVWLIDFEDSDVTAVSRLLELGARRQAVKDHFAYIHPDTVLSDLAYGPVAARLAVAPPALIIVDSVGEWMGMDGLEAKDLQVARWFHTGPRRLITPETAVVILDHSPLGDLNRLDPIDSQRKKAAINGAQYLLRSKPKAEFGRGKAGRAELVTAKDRHGHTSKGQVAGLFALDAQVTPYIHSLAVSAATLPEGPVGMDGGGGIPSELPGVTPAARRVHAVLANDDWPMTAGEIQRRISADDERGGLAKRTIQDALKALEAKGLATATKHADGYQWRAMPAQPCAQAAAHESSAVAESGNGS